MTTCTRRPVPWRAVLWLVATAAATARWAAQAPLAWHHIVLAAVAFAVLLAAAVAPPNARRKLMNKPQPTARGTDRWPA